MSYPSNVIPIVTKNMANVSVSAVANKYAIKQNSRMKRESVYPYTETDPPGINVHRLREQKGWSLRDLADNCHPPIAHTTVSRLEKNRGFTQDTIERVAAALGSTPGDLWLPADLFDYRLLSTRQKDAITAMVQDLAAAHSRKKSA